MKPKHPLLQKSLIQLESLPNLQVEVKAMPFISKSLLADGQLVLQGSSHPVEYICEIKPEVSTEDIDFIVDYFYQFSKKLDAQQKPLLITQNLSEPIINRLLDLGINFIDVNGNTYLNSPGIYILVRRNPQHVPNDGLTNASIKLMYTLLKRPELLTSSEFDVDLQKVTQIPFDSVIQNLQKLCQLDYLRFRNGKFKIIDYLKLVERWELGYIENLRPNLFVERYAPVKDQSLEEFSEILKLHAEVYGYLIGGEMGAGFATGHLRSPNVTLHIPENNYSVFLKLKLKPDQQGEITLFNQFGRLNGWDEKIPFLVDPLLIHAELHRSNSDRVKEASQQLFEQYIVPRMIDAGA